MRVFFYCFSGRRGGREEEGERKRNLDVGETHRVVASCTHPGQRQEQTETEVQTLDWGIETVTLWWAG